jgi:hypothetical protein
MSDSLRNLVVRINFIVLYLMTALSSVTREYQSELTNNSLKYIRPGGSTQKFYYEAIQLTTSMSGNFTFTSGSNLDIYGYFYNGSFDPSDPSRNLAASDDDSAIGVQFSLKLSLRSDYIYTLVVTTYSANVVTRFSITVFGPNSTVNFNGKPLPLLPTTTTTACK